jgi:hypothetical protein
MVKVSCMDVSYKLHDGLALLHAYATYESFVVQLEGRLETVDCRMHHMLALEPTQLRAHDL